MNATTERPKWKNLIKYRHYTKIRTFLNSITFFLHKNNTTKPSPICAVKVKVLEMQFCTSNSDRAYITLLKPFFGKAINFIKHCPTIHYPFLQLEWIYFVDLAYILN